MKLPQAPAQYDKQDQVNLRAALMANDMHVVKKNEELQPVRLVMQDTVTGTRYLVTVASGAWTLTAL